MSKEKYPSINGLRAISVVLVMIGHLAMQDHIFKDLVDIKWLSPFLYFLQDGQLGVNVFFVISGFLITTLMLREEFETKTISLKKFYVRRTLRIFPAYYFLLFIYLILQLLNLIYLSSASWITSLTYTKYFNWNVDWVTAHAWSLSVEEHFYILWPLIFLAGDAFRKKAAILLIILVPIIKVFSYFYSVSWINELTIFYRIDSVATGCLIALYQKSIVKKISPYWNRLFYASIIILFFLRYFQAIANKLHIGILFMPFGTTYGTIANSLIAIIMMYTVFGPQGLLYKFLNLKYMNYIGILSYSIYLWQQIFLSDLNYWVTKFPQNLAFIILMALFSYHIIERPFLKLKSRFS